ncbi:MAG TPA: transglycosylase domain-containing protein, partial [Candidatus Binataceae bacterium]|nr:transglycosylase domain-containing protein [Candidatus Binataceae bacterium]
MSFKRILKFTALAFAVLFLFAAAPAVYYFSVYYQQLEQEVVARFSGKRWDIPSRIYSDSTTVYPGQKLSDLDFTQRLARLNYHLVEPGQVRARGEYSYDQTHQRLVIFLHAFGYPYLNFPGELDELQLAQDGTIESMTDLVTRKPIYAFELEPELISGIFEGSWDQRWLVRLDQIPPALTDAILAAEDHRFYEHHGVDPVRIIKAALVDLTSGHIRQGGSTLTQQLMKNFFLSSSRSYKRKIKEALMAYIAERKYTKDEILENYVNDIYLGQRGQEGIYGVWEASEYYFSKEPKDLTLGEMATIAGLIREPNKLNPLRHAAESQKRRNEVLASML